ncbi:MAG: hypothetical protein P8184_15835 [Calditrichia bacterium]
MINRKILFGLVVIGLLCSFVIPRHAGAIPAFARQYKISCTTCHDPFPRLKPYGEEFAGNGFILKEDLNPRDFITAGDPILFLNRTFPIAVRFDAFGVYEQDAEVETDLETPWGVKLLSGGPLYRNIGYYFYFYLSERGEVAGIEDAYIHFDNIFKTNLDVMVGQFQTSDPLMKRELRLTFEDYVFYTTRIGESSVNLTYDRGIMLAYGIDKSRTDMVALVGNGNGKGAADEETGKFDKDKYKNFALRLKQDVMNISGLGVYFYYGKEKLGYQIFTEAGPLTQSYDNVTTYIGPDLNFNIGKFAFTGSYLIRNDTEPIHNVKDINSSGLVAEVIFAPQMDKSRYYITGLYNLVDSDLNEYDYESGTISGSYLVARNLRLIGEVTRNFRQNINRAVVGLGTAF